MSIELSCYLTFSVNITLTEYLHFHMLFIDANFDDHIDYKLPS